MHEVLVNRLGDLSLPRNSVVRLTDRPEMTLDVYRGRKTTTTTVISVTGITKQGTCCKTACHNYLQYFNRIFGFRIETTGSPFTIRESKFTY